MAKKQIVIKESELRNKVHGMVMEALDEIGNTPAGQFMLGRLAHRKGEPVDAKGRMRKDKEKYPIFNYADKAQKKAGMYDRDFNTGKDFQDNLEDFVDDLETYQVEGDPRDATYEIPGGERQKKTPAGELRYDNEGNPVMSKAYNRGSSGEMMHNLFRSRNGVNSYKNYPGKVDKEYMFGGQDPAIMPFDITQREYFPGSNANPATADKAKRAKPAAEPATSGAIREAVEKSVRKVLKEMSEGKI